MKLVAIPHCNECPFPLRFIGEPGAAWVECKLAGRILLPDETILPSDCPIRDGVELVSPGRLAQEDLEFGELAPSKPEEGRFVLKYDRGFGYLALYWNLDGVWFDRSAPHIKVFTERSKARKTIRHAANRTGVKRKLITIEDYAVPHNEESP